jgi:hypothetical protein
MTEVSSDYHKRALNDATEELNRLLLVGSFSQRLMRLYALSELVSEVPPELLLRAAANFADLFPEVERKAA